MIPCAIPVRVSVHSHGAHGAGTLFSVCTRRRGAAGAWNRGSVHAIAALVGLTVAVLVHHGCVADLCARTDIAATGTPRAGRLIGTGNAGLTASLADSFSVEARMRLAGAGGAPDGAGTVGGLRIVGLAVAVIVQGRRAIPRRWVDVARTGTPDAVLTHRFAHLANPYSSMAALLGGAIHARAAFVGRGVAIVVVA